MPRSVIERIMSQLKGKYHQWIPIVQLYFRRLQKEEALKARVVKANETGEKEKVIFFRYSVASGHTHSNSVDLFISCQY